MRAPRRLPGIRFAIADEQKITRYLLASDHPVGKAKAAVFHRFGFDASEWEVLRDALLAHARSGRILSVGDTEFGKKYIVEGMLRTPDGRGVSLRAVCFISTGEAAPRLVTAYALPGATR